MQEVIIKKLSNKYKNEWGIDSNFIAVLPEFSRPTYTSTVILLTDHKESLFEKCEMDYIDLKSISKCTKKEESTKEYIDFKKKLQKYFYPMEIKIIHKMNLKKHFIKN